MTTAELNATDATQKPQHQHDAHGGHAEHGVPLWGLFLALLALTAAEVGLFELWHYTKEQGDPLMPKFAMVVLLLVFTFPKAAIVLIYFMHLKFEKHMVVTLAIAPFIMVGIAILPMLADTTALSPRADNKCQAWATTRYIRTANMPNTTHTVRPMANTATIKAKDLNPVTSKTAPPSLIPLAAGMIPSPNSAAC